MADFAVSAVRGDEVWHIECQDSHSGKGCSLSLTDAEFGQLCHMMVDDKFDSQHIRDIWPKNTVTPFP